MGEASKIEWTDHTFNPWIGCTKVSEGCRSCYAETYADRYGIATWGPAGTRKRTAASTWAQPRKWSRRAKADQEAAALYPGNMPIPPRPTVFCASLADVFEARDDLDPIRADLWRLIEECDGLTWLLLTKRPDQIRRRVPARWLEPGGWPAHVWVGTSVEDQAAADTRIPHLLGVPASVRFLSCEPLLGPVTLPLDGIGWVIVGGESGAHARPMHPECARSVRDQCVAAGVPFFFKQWGEWARVPRDAAHAEVWLGAVNVGRMCFMGRVGKAKAGRALDGRTWGEVPNGGAT